MPNKEQYAKRREYYMEYDKKRGQTPERKEYNKKREQTLERKEYQKKYRLTPEYKELRKKYDKKYRKEGRIKEWKKWGIICDYDAIYDIYINTNNCDHCKKEFESSYHRCLDHCHTCATVRAILCRRCNLNDRVKCFLC